MNIVNRLRSPRFVCTPALLFVAAVLAPSMGFADGIVFASGNCSIGHTGTPEGSCSQLAGSVTPNGGNTLTLSGTATTQDNGQGTAVLEFDGNSFDPASGSGALAVAWDFSVSAAAAISGTWSATFQFGNSALQESGVLNFVDGIASVSGSDAFIPPNSFNGTFMSLNATVQVTPGSSITLTDRANTIDGNINQSSASTPEPGSVVLLLSGIAGAAAVARRRKV